MLDRRIEQRLGALKRKGKAIKKWLRIVGFTLLTLFIVLLALQAFLLTSYGQTMVVKRLSRYVEEEYNIKVYIGKVRLEILDKVSMDQVYILDHREDTLLYIAQVRGHLRDFAFTAKKNSLDISKFRLKDPYFNLYVEQGDSLSNLDHVLAQLPESEPDTTAAVPFHAKLKSLLIQNGRFSWHDYNRTPTDTGIDWSHLDIGAIHLELSRASMDADTILASIDSLRLRERSGFVLNQLEGNARFDPVQIALDQMEFLTPHTQLHAKCALKYDSLADFSDFVQKVRLNTLFENSIVHARDIAYFAPDLTGIADSIQLNGRIRGTLANLKAKKLDIRYGDGTVIRGNMNIDGLPDINNTFLMLELTELRTSQRDLDRIPIPPFGSGATLETPDVLKRFGTMRFDGMFTGFINDFVAYGNFESALGKLSTDVKLSQGENNSLQYRGRLKANRFHLGKLADAPEIGTVTMALHVDGQDIDLQKISAHFNGEIQEITLNEYTYRDIELRGDLERDLFSGFVEILDENVQLTFRGDMELSKEEPRFEFIADVKEAYPARLNLVDLDSSFRVDTRMVFDFQGNSINNVLGRASLEDLRIETKDHIYESEYIHFNASTTEEGKTLGLESPRVHAKLSGDFNSVGLPDAINYLSYKVFPSMFEEAPEKPNARESFDFQLTIRELEDASRMFTDDLVAIEDSLRVMGSFDLASERVRIDMFSERLDIAGIRHDSLLVSIFDRGDSIVFESSIHKLFLTDSASMQNVRVKTVAREDVILLSAGWDNQQQTHRHAGDIEVMAHVYSPELLKIDVLESSITVNDSVWNFSDMNYILFDQNEIHVHNLRLSHNDQYIFIDGRISDLPDDEMRVEVQDIRLQFLSALFMPSGFDLRGTIDGGVALRSVRDNFTFNSNIHLNGVVLNQYPFGSGLIRTEYIREKQELEMSAWLVNDEQRTLNLTGSYFPQREEENIDVRADFQEFPLRNLEPFLKEYASEIEGVLKGSATVTGNISEPKVRGELALKDFSSRVAYT
ncbi:MAG: DUF748 domain-containing protein, partial [Leptolyngbya sp. SIO3F4]|nr:DUF748 domain-containing protein [Leptolyngbya sp. SIO3F4]